MNTKRWRLFLTVLVMLTFMSKALGMASPPPEGMGAARSVDLSGNVFQFAMPEGVSRDMPAAETVERLDISVPSIVSDPANSTLMQRCGDMKDPGFLGNKL